jgi:uncharacterized protein (DUF2147 family)
VLAIRVLDYMRTAMTIAILRQFQWLLILALAFMYPVRGASAADLSSPAGWWQPIDEKTGRPLGLIRIYEERGLFFGRIEPSSPSDDASRRCSKCSDERRNQPIIGLVLMRNMRPHGDEYVGGDILDPNTGRIYGCKFRLADGGTKLIMRGFFGLSIFGRSQTWQRAEGQR